MKVKLGSILMVAILALVGALVLVQTERELESCEYAVQELKAMHGEAMDALEQCIIGRMP